MKHLGHRIISVQSRGGSRYCNGENTVTLVCTKPLCKQSGWFKPFASCCGLVNNSFH